MFDYFSLYFSEENEDGVVDSSQDNKDCHKLRSIGGYELHSSYKDHQILVYAEYAVTSNVDLLVILSKESST